jgi:hypothetical protein
MKYKYIAILLSLLFSHQITRTHAQLNHELGVEITAASFSTFGGTVGGGLKYGIALDNGLVFGPSFRYQYFWSKNNFTGVGGSGSIYGGGVFLHYRFMEWFFAGTEIEMLRNPFGASNLTVKPERWTPTIFLGLGMSKEFPINNYPIRLNLGIFYDLYDGLRDDLNSQPSPLRNNYFFKVQDPNNPNFARYLPFIYRIAVFIPLTQN